MLLVVAVAVISFFLRGVIAGPAVSWAFRTLWLILQLLLWLTVITVIILVLRKVNTINEAAQQLDTIADTLEKNRSVLEQIRQTSRLSEKAKEIVFHDSDRQALREAVFDKMQQQDFDGTYDLINEIATTTAYKKLAKQLRVEADKYRHATDAERVNQIISHIEKLFETHQWTKAGALIERLIKSHPNLDDTKIMRQRLVDKKQERKKILLNAWDDAVKRQATDRSIEILKELDLYLTPNEGLALQQAAKSVFKNKLHSLGVKFALAVSEKKWNNALEAGHQIIRDFPNSRMAEEIREKIEILKQKAQK